MSNDWLRNLYGHQSWADAEQWRAIGEHPAARRSGRFSIDCITFTSFSTPSCGRLATGKEPVRRPPGRGIRLVRRSCVRTPARISPQISPPRGADRRAPRRTGDDCVVHDPPLTITVAEALTQCTMHSHYHRGQNADAPARARRHAADHRFDRLAMERPSRGAW